MEFDLIQRWFESRFEALSQGSRHLELGIGDDCAIFKEMPGHRIVTSTDLLCQGRHFFSDTCPRQIGFKSLAVNLSDLAAMGATPLGFTLGLSIGQVDEHWLDQFSAGLLEIATDYGCPLVGGDTTGAHDPNQLLISITVFGTLPAGSAGLKRSGALIGNDIWVSGLPGLARLGLLSEIHQRGLLQNELSEADCDQFHQVWGLLEPEQKKQCLDALHRPTPRVELGQQLLALARCAIDLSDGLAGDLSHVCKSSHLKGSLYENDLNHFWMNWAPQLTASLPFLRNVSLMGGDDYELCFIAPANHSDQITQLADRVGLSLTKIGKMGAGQGIELVNATSSTELNIRSYNHFS